MSTSEREQIDAPRRPRAPDHGTTFVELLVSIVLIGTVVIAVLVALQAATVASTIDAKHARAYVWLHEASDRVFEATRVPCNAYDGSGDVSDPANWPTNVGDSDDVLADGTVWGAYNDVVEAMTPPQGLPGADMSITKIEFLRPTGPQDTTFDWGTDCFEGVIDTVDGNGDPIVQDYRETPLVSQKVTLTFTSAGGSVIKTLETVKADS